MTNRSYTMKIKLTLFITILFVFLSQNSYADINKMQQKYSGYVLNGKELSRHDIKDIYNRLPSTHPFHAFDQITRSRSALKEIKQNCEYKYLRKYNYVCAMPGGTAELKTKNDKVLAYRLTGSFDNFITEISQAFIKADVSSKERKLFLDMMFDMVLTRFNDVSPKGITYYRKGEYVIVEGKIN